MLELTSKQQRHIDAIMTKEDVVKQFWTCDEYIVEVQTRLNQSWDLTSVDAKHIARFFYKMMHIDEATKEYAKYLAISSGP